MLFWGHLSLCRASRVYYSNYRLGVKIQRRLKTCHLCSLLLLRLKVVAFFVRNL
jgi:hypothetical protein